MDRYARHESHIQRPTPPWEPSQTGLDKLVVQFGRSDGEDRWGNVSRNEPMCQDMDGQEDEGDVAGEA